MRRIGSWIVFAGGLLLVAWYSLERVHNKQLFLLRLPIDRDPLALELHDASVSAETWKIPALVFLAVATAAASVTVHSGLFGAMRDGGRRLHELFRLHPRLCVLFIAASVADFLSTAVYFHTHRIDDELHPGIKLVTYAYGLSIGCLIGKTIQALLALMVCALFPAIARPMLIVLMMAYAAAAVWNLAVA